MKPRLPIREQIDTAKQKDFISVSECALLVGCSERTIWRRLAKLDRVIRDGRVTRLHRATAMRYFLKFPPPPNL